MLNRDHALSHLNIEVFGPTFEHPSCSSAMSAARWTGGRGCRCPGGAQCAHQASCCGGVGSPGQQRAYRVLDAARHPTRCLGCAGITGRSRSREPMRRPAAFVSRRPAAAAALPAAAAGPVQPPVVPAAPVGVPAAGVVLTVAQVDVLVAHTAALTACVAAMDHWVEALTAHTHAVSSGVAPRAPQVAVAAAAEVAAAPPVPRPLAVHRAVACPSVLAPSKAALDDALRGSAPVVADVVLRASGARVPLNAWAWVRLRAVIVVHRPDEWRRVGGAELEMRRNSASIWERRVSAGQLHEMVVSGLGTAPTILNHVARYLLANPDVRQRCAIAARLLRDVRVAT